MCLLVAAVLAPLAAVPVFADPTGIIKATIVRAAGLLALLFMAVSYLRRGASGDAGPAGTRVQGLQRPAVDPPTLLFSLAVVIAILATVFSSDPYLSFFGRHLGYMGLWTFTGLFGLFIAAMRVASVDAHGRHAVDSTGSGTTKRKRSQPLRPARTSGSPPGWSFRISRWLVVSSCLIGLLAVAQALGGYTYIVDIGPVFGVRAYGTLGNPDFLGMYLVAALGPALAWFVRALPRKGVVKRDSFPDDSPLSRVTGLASPLIIIMAIVLSGSRGAMMGAVVAGLVYFVVRALQGTGAHSSDDLRRRTRLGMLLGGAAASIAIIATLAVAYGSPVPGADGRPVASGDTAALRVLAWRGSVDIIAGNPLLGVGPEALSIHLPTAMPFAQGQHHRLVPEDAHNLPLTITATTGLASLMVLTLLYVTVAGGVLRGAPTRTLAGAFAGFTGYLTTALFNPEDMSAAAVAWILAGLVAGEGYAIRLDDDAEPKRRGELARHGRVKLAGAAGASALLGIMLMMTPFPVIAEALYSSAQRAGDLNSALSRLETATRLAPYDEWYAARLIEAQLQASTSAPGLAVAAADRAVAAARTWPQSSHVNLLAADALDRAELLGAIPAGAGDRALEYAGRAVRLRPDSPDALVAHARIAQRRGQKAIAREAASAFLKLGLDDSRETEMRSILSLTPD